MKRKFEEYFMSITEATASLSSSKRLKVGSIIVNNDEQIISSGYNGTIKGMDNCCEDENGNTHSEVIHAEVNALLKILSSSARINESTKMFVTHAPCKECAKIIAVAGIKTVYYRNDYRCTDGLEFLEKCGIKVIKI